MQQHLPLAIEKPTKAPSRRPTPAAGPARARRAVDWRIDGPTRRVGMAGIARARAALAATDRERTGRRGRPSAA